MLEASLLKYSLEYPYAELRQATEGFSNDGLLGKGSFGAVYRGTQRDGTNVAIKVLDAPAKAGFEEEVRVLSKFRHPNLVILMGFARHGQQRMLVYEFLEGGDVYKRLQKSNDGQLRFPWLRRIAVALDAACGLSHLHNSTPKVFHRDIKSLNILLDRSGTAKMADFGLACLSATSSYGMKVQETGGTVGYADPLYVSRGIVTEGSEVFSFGVVLLELLTARAAAWIENLGGRQCTRLLVTAIAENKAKVLSLLDEQAGWPSKMAASLAELALQCTNSREEVRPDFAAVVRRLRRHLELGQAQEAECGRHLEDDDMFFGCQKDQSAKRAEQQLRRKTSKANFSVLPTQQQHHHPVQQQQPQCQDLDHQQQLLQQYRLQQQQQQQLLAQQMEEEKRQRQQQMLLLQQQIQQQQMQQQQMQLQQVQQQQVQQQVLQEQPEIEPEGCQQAAWESGDFLWALEVTAVLGKDTSQLPLEHKALVQMAPQGNGEGMPTMRVGRLFQEELFQMLLGEASQSISREHMQIWAAVPCDGHAPLSLLLTNYSSGRTMLNGMPMEELGNEAMLNDGDVIELGAAAAALNGKVCMPLLQLTLRMGKAMSNAKAAMAREVPEASTATPSSPSEVSQGSEAGTAAYCLLLRGSGVREGVPDSDLCLSVPAYQPDTQAGGSLVIGRGYDPEFWYRILATDTVNSFSRQHFQVATMEGHSSGAPAMIRCLSQRYPITVRRRTGDQEGAVTLDHCHPPVPLWPGDDIEVLEGLQMLFSMC
mmetsp:Transcript_51427/g.122244  ORF Transcript_51427/g.122244 Transcript_51427/m.122244 type:complete len:763 (-) Transcript_51427:76-2364(-)